MNSVNLIGHLTDEVKLTTTPTGKMMCKGILAVTDHYKNKQGESIQETTYVAIQAFGGLADLIQRNSFKGCKLGIKGRLKSVFWKDEYGEEQRDLKVLIEQIEFLTKNYNNYTTYDESRGDDETKKDSPFYELKDELQRQPERAKREQSSKFPENENVRMGYGGLEKKSLEISASELSSDEVPF